MRAVASGLSDVGRSRQFNEDSFAIDEERGFFLVADGMGGHEHGDVASRLAVSVIRERLRRDGEGADGEGLRRAVEEAHRQLRRAMDCDDDLDGMGTTLVGLRLLGESAAVAHVGDSRAYRLRDGRLELLTEDHTWIREQLSAGHLSNEQARHHPLRNVVTRALDGRSDLAVDVREVPLRRGDLFLLCSDGLTAMLDDEEIRGLLVAGDEPEELTRSLVDEANRRGGHDNITVVLVAVDPAV